MTGAPLSDDEIRELLALCEADAQPYSGLTAYQQQMAAENRTYYLADVARTALPRLAREVLEWRDENAEAAGAIVELQAEVERTKAELARWRALQPGLDRLADLTDTCEGADPLPAAAAEIVRLGRLAEKLSRALDAAGGKRGMKSFRDELETENERLAADAAGLHSLVAMLSAENARLRRALDAADIVMGSEG